jgi:hypothetical protein
MKNCVRENNGMREYLETLAAAYRAGYQQTPENNFQRLEAWQAERLEEAK